MFTDETKAIFRQFPARVYAETEFLRTTLSTLYHDLFNQDPYPTDLRVMVKVAEDFFQPDDGPVEI